MKAVKSLGLIATLGAGLVIVGAAGERERGLQTEAPATPAVQSTQTVPATIPLAKPEAEPEAVAVSPAANYQLNWYSINGGGAVNAISTSYRMGLSVGQSVAGQGRSTNYQMGIGFWYGAAGGTVPCAVAKTGDVNESGDLTAADIIAMVVFVFKSGPTPLPCEAAGDVNCNAAVTASDIIYMVQHVFKGGPEPCDVCTLIPATWSCP